VIAGFGAKDVAKVKTSQLLDVRTVAGQGVFNDDDFHMRMFSTKLFEEAVGGISFGYTYIVCRLSVRLNEKVYEQGF